MGIWTESNQVKGGEKVKEVRFSAEKLSVLMKRRGLNDYDVAELTGISRTMVFYLRKGQRPKPAAEMVSRLASGLKIPIGDLMTDDDVMQTSATEEVPEAIRQLAEIAGKLSEVRREELLRIAGALEKLEREQTTHPLPSATMSVLLQIIEKLEANDATEDVLAPLKDFLRNPPQDDQL